MPEENEIKEQEELLEEVDISSVEETSPHTEEEIKDAEALGYELLPKDDKLDKYYKKALNSLKKADNTDFAQYYFDMCNTGENRFYQKNITETKYFDEEWIKTMEAFFPNIDRIIRNPKKTIRYEEEVVPIEKAKKTNSQSIRHLASHTQLIREVDEDGFVVPKKILTTFAEEDIETYENRFAMTLINRLHMFVRARYEIIKDNVESFQHDHLVYTSNFNIKDENVTFKLDVDIKRDLDNPNINKHNYELYQRVDKLMTLINGYKNSQFMKDMKKAKKVMPPIMKTNVILKNPDFKNAYALWLFLDRYTSLAYDINVRERPVRLSREFKSNIDRVSAMAYAALVNNKKKRNEDFTVIENVEPVVKKSTKVAKNDISDYIKRPDSIKIEDTLINEYYLEQNKKVINQKIKEQVDEMVPEPTAAKKVIKESLQITNSMFDTVFGLETEEQETDYFSKFVNNEKPEELYADAKKKARIAKVIREAKEVDLKKSIKLEKDLYKQMLRATNIRIRMLNEKRKQAQLEKLQEQYDRELKKNKEEKKRLKALIDELDGKLVEIDGQRSQLEEEIEQFRIENEQIMRQETEEFNRKLNEELALIKEENLNKLRALKEKLKAKAKEVKEKRAEKLARVKEEIEEKKNLILQEFKDNAETAMKNLKLNSTLERMRIKKAIYEILGKESDLTPEEILEIENAANEEDDLLPADENSLNNLTEEIYELIASTEGIKEEPVQEDNVETPIEEETEDLNLWGEGWNDAIENKEPKVDADANYLSGYKSAKNYISIGGLNTNTPETVDSEEASEEAKPARKPRNVTTRNKVVKSEEIEEENEDLLEEELPDEASDDDINVDLPENDVDLLDAIIEEEVSGEQESIDNDVSEVVVSDTNTKQTEILDEVPTYKPKQKPASSRRRKPKTLMSKEEIKARLRNMNQQGVFLTGLRKDSANRNEES